jgi:hypothetical protein
MSTDVLPVATTVRNQTVTNAFKWPVVGQRGITWRR